MTRAKNSESDPQMAMLIYRSTPFKAGVASPAELLNGRRYQDLIPTRQHLNTQQDKSREVLLSDKNQVTNNYNKQARERTELQEMQRVWYQKDPTKPRWEQATVVQTADQPRSFIVQDDAGAQYQRNSRHIRPAAREPSTELSPETDVSPDRRAEVPQPQEQRATESCITRSGRISRKPERYGH